MGDGGRGGEAREIKRDMMRLTLTIVAKTLCDVDVCEDAGAVGEALSILLVETANATQSPLFIPKWVPTAANRRSKRAVSQINGIVNRIINERRGSTEDKG